MFGLAYAFSWWVIFAVFGYGICTVGALAVDTFGHTKAENIRRAIFTFYGMAIMFNIVTLFGSMLGAYGSNILGGDFLSPQEFAATRGMSFDKPYPIVPPGAKTPAHGSYVKGGTFTKMTANDFHKDHNVTFFFDSQNVGDPMTIPSDKVVLKLQPNMKSTGTVTFTYKDGSDRDTTRDFGTVENKVSDCKIIIQTAYLADSCQAHALPPKISSNGIKEGAQLLIKHNVDKVVVTVPPALYARLNA